MVAEHHHSPECGRPLQEDGIPGAGTRGKAYGAAGVDRPVGLDPSAAPNPLRPVSRCAGKEVLRGARIVARACHPESQASVMRITDFQDPGNERHGAATRPLAEGHRFVRSLRTGPGGTLARQLARHESPEEVVAADRPDRVKHLSAEEDAWRDAAAQGRWIDLSE